MNVGDEVRWSRVPDNTLVRHRGNGRPYLGDAYLVFRSDMIFECSAAGRRWFAPLPPNPDIVNTRGLWDHMARQNVIIVATDLTGAESAEELKQTAEEFEVAQTRRQFAAN